MTTWNDTEVAELADDLKEVERIREIHSQLLATNDRLLTAEEIIDMPLPQWLVTQFLIEGGLGCLAGQPAEGKTFLALDWAMSIASGNAWFGHPVSQGPTVFVAAEGSAGLGPRIRAWKQYYGVDTLPMWFLARSVQMLDREDVERGEAQVSVGLAEQVAGVFDGVPLPEERDQDPDEEIDFI